MVLPQKKIKSSNLKSEFCNFIPRLAYQVKLIDSKKPRWLLLQYYK